MRSLPASRRGRWRAAAAGLAAAAAACASPPGVSGPNVLLVTVDTQRADHTSAYGYTRRTTPLLDALAADGTLFTACYTPTPTTGPSHATLLTARYPSSHGVLKNGHVLAGDRPTLAQVFRDAGYATAAVIGGYPLASRFGYGRGFERYDDDFRPSEATMTVSEWEGVTVAGAAFDRRADAATARAQAWLETARSGGRPLFLWVHYYDPHGPYDPPASYRDHAASLPPGLERRIAAYDGEIRFTDHQLGRLVDAFDAAAGSDALVVVATDHGEGLMQHGWMEHGANLYEELVRTVLVFRWPGRVRTAQRMDGPVGLVDVAPTILALAGLPAAGLAPEGIDLSPTLLHGTPPPASRPLFLQRRPYEGDPMDVPVRGPMLGVRLGDLKYIEAPAAGVAELYDLAEDPAETRNLAGARPADTTALAATLAEWQRGAEAATAGRQRQTVSPEDRDRLRALGYVE